MNRRGHEPGWLGNLNLQFARRDERTLLVRKSHCGPLQIQKTLYPEGPGICHATVLHPPGGIAAGDSLRVSADLGPGSRVCLTTPGATKWYRCPEGAGRQQMVFSLAEGAALEWLPRENILFDAARARMKLEVALAPGAQFLGWEILCFGRRASGETWRAGGLRLDSRIQRAGRPLWSEHAEIVAGSGFGTSPVGLAGSSVNGTFVAAGANIDSALLAACRSIVPEDRAARVGITALPNIGIARYLGHSSEDAFRWFSSLWAVLRPPLLGVAATAPRLWAC